MSWGSSTATVPAIARKPTGSQRSWSVPSKGPCGVAETYAPLNWDLHLPWLLMGYMFSTQHALGVVSPYELLYGKRALLPLRGQPPPAAWHQLLPKDLDDPHAWAQALQARARLYQLMLPAALEHLQAAQDRDRRRHASRSHDSSGAPWQPHPHQEGDLSTCDGRRGTPWRRIKPTPFCGCTVSRLAGV